MKARSGLFVIAICFKHVIRLMISSTLSDEEWVHDLRKVLIETGVLYRQNKLD